MNKTEALLIAWIFSIVVIGSLMFYYKVTAPRVVIEWKEPNVEVIGNAKVIVVKIVDSKLLVVLDNGETLTFDLPREKIASSTYDMLVPIFIADVLMGWIPIILSLDI